MASNISNNFSQVFPKHPHRRLRILISILCFVIVVGLVVLYQINKLEKISPPTSQSDRAVQLLQIARSYPQSKISDSEAIKLLKTIKNNQK